jgi:hypothetical protein
MGVMLNLNFRQGVTTDGPITKNPVNDTRNIVVDDQRCRVRRGISHYAAGPSTTLTDGHIVLFELSGKYIVGIQSRVTHKFKAMGVFVQHRGVMSDGSEPSLVPSLQGSNASVTLTGSAVNVDLQQQGQTDVTVAAYNEPFASAAQGWWAIRSLQLDGSTWKYAWYYLDCPQNWWANFPWGFVGSVDGELFRAQMHDIYDATSYNNESVPIVISFWYYDKSDVVPGFKNGGAAAAYPTEVVHFPIGGSALVSESTDSIVEGVHCVFSKNGYLYWPIVDLTKTVLRIYTFHPKTRCIKRVVQYTLPTKALYLYCHGINSRGHLLFSQNSGTLPLQVRFFEIDPTDATASVSAYITVNANYQLVPDYITVVPLQGGTFLWTDGFGTIYSMNSSMVNSTWKAVTGPTAYDRVHLQTAMGDVDGYVYAVQKNATGTDLILRFASDTTQSTHVSGKTLNDETLQTHPGMWCYRLGNTTYAAGLSTTGGESGLSSIVVDGTLTDVTSELYDGVDAVSTACGIRYGYTYQGGVIHQPDAVIQTMGAPE